MILTVYAIKDSLVGFDRLFTAPSDAVATRIFSDACNDNQTVIARHPGDFDLYSIATLDTLTGKVEEHGSFVARASDMFVKE